MSRLLFKDIGAVQVSTLIGDDKNENSSDALLLKGINRPRKLSEFIDMSSHDHNDNSHSIRKRDAKADDKYKNQIDKQNYVNSLSPIVSPPFDEIVNSTSTPKIV